MLYIVLKNKVKKSIVFGVTLINLSIIGALEDFNTTGKPKDTNQSSQDSKVSSKRPDPPSNLWNEEFLQQTTARFEQNIQALFSPGNIYFMIC